MGKAIYTYHIESKSIHITTTNIRDIAKLLGLSSSTIQKLVTEPNTKNLLSNFITITREKLKL